MNDLRPPTPTPQKPLKMGERGKICWEYVLVASFIILIACVFTWLGWTITHQPPSIYKAETPLPLLQYLNSDNHITMENLTEHFIEYREPILEELDRLIDDKYVDRIFKGGVYYYRVNGWGALYLDYLEARLK